MVSKARGVLTFVGALLLLPALALAALAERAESALDVGEVARRLGASSHMVRKLVRLRLIPYYKVGSAVRFRPADVDAWFEARRVGPAPENVRARRSA